MNQESVPNLPKGSQNKNLSEEQDAVVPLQDVKAALQVANAKQEIYSASTLAYLVRKYTVLGVLAISILGSGCAPLIQPREVVFFEGTPGPQGEVGPQGPQGSSCTTTQLSNGLRISCPDGTESVVLNGQDAAPPSYYGVTSIVDPCGRQGSFDEVLLKLSNGQILAHFASGAQQFLAIIGNGTYSTTDGTSCTFTITSEGEITNEHN